MNVPKATSTAGSYFAVEYQSPTTLASGCNSNVKVASLPGKGISAATSVSCYRTNVKIPPIGESERVGATQREELNITSEGNLSAKRSVSPDKQSLAGTALPGGNRTGSTIVLISTKISNPSVAKLGSAGGALGATIKTTGTLYNIPSSPVAINDEGDNRKQSMLCQEIAKLAGEEEGNGQSEAQSTSKTATILVSKHKTKTGLPLLLKKSKK